MSRNLISFRLMQKLINSVCNITNEKLVPFWLRSRVDQNQNDEDMIQHLIRIGKRINDIFNIDTRGSKFWSSKVCEGGESREAYACRLNFDPPQFLFEINDHVTKTHFWSAFKRIENLILIQFELIKMDQN